MVLGCAGGSHVTVVPEICEVVAVGLSGDGKGGQTGALGDRGVGSSLKKLSNLNCLPFSNCFLIKLLKEL